MEVEAQSLRDGADDIPKVERGHAEKFFAAKLLKTFNSFEDDLTQLRLVEHLVGHIKDVTCADGIHLADDVVHIFYRFAHEERAGGAQ